MALIALEVPFDKYLLMVDAGFWPWMHEHGAFTCHFRVHDTKPNMFVAEFKEEAALIAFKLRWA